MAREIEDRRLTEAPPRIPGPPAPPEKRPARWLPWVGVVVLVALLGGLLLFMRGKPAHHPTPVNSVGASGPTPSAAPSAAPSLSAPVPATTYQAFAALPMDQQKAVMLAAINRYDEVLNQAYETLNGSLLPLVATGANLSLLQQKMVTVRNTGYALKEVDQNTVLQVLIPPSVDLVSIQLQSISTLQYVSPTTLQPVSSPGAPSSSTTIFTFVIQDGTWKVSEHLQVNQ
jgi:hypothetical protein